MMTLRLKLSVATIDNQDYMNFSQKQGKGSKVTSYSYQECPTDSRSTILETHHVDSHA